ncbi:unnamed protein product [Rotaria magnacalcarata]|uniref:SH2 domain-containing protein n=2 Tax=Rotaria magnacalcarata TaxID=392030 RepID=A0A816TEF0_9BILA|nr:unnamed protein product [Rotaria magnacalcarata]CAF1665824.1 unnamed protein product [Rotaria magnacalcarata]CAF2099977.1 unnamed protein product [Rotaria magnacalcarata]
MNNLASMDPYFDDEDEENEEIYRRLLRNRETLPSCDKTTLPYSSFSQPCILCSRVEAENILKKTSDVQPGHFIIRPSGAHTNYPYSLTVLFNNKIVYHFQICQKSNKYSIEPYDRIDLSTSKVFRSLSNFVEYYLTRPIIFQVDDNKQKSITLKLYPVVELTRL